MTRINFREVLETSATAALSKEGSDDVSIVCVSTVRNLPPSSNVLEKLFMVIVTAYTMQLLTKLDLLSKIAMEIPLLPGN